MLNVYQIRLTHEEVVQVTALGWGVDNPKIQAYGARHFGNKIKNVNMDHYDLVAKVDTNDLEEAFELMNLWDHPERVTKLSSCSSMSVGDVVEDEDGNRFLCASFGFDKI